MSTAKEDRTILDYLLGIQRPQGEMLKVLMKRVGIGRNEWHSAAESRTGRTWSSKSRISDMFSGKRPIPLRDIIPMVDALELSAEETDHYCCEFFRANVPENLQRYITPNRRNKRLLLLQRRNDDLDEAIGVWTAHTIRKRIRDENDNSRNENANYINGYVHSGILSICDSRDRETQEFLAKCHHDLILLSQEGFNQSGLGKLKDIAQGINKHRFKKLIYDEYTDLLDLRNDALADEYFEAQAALDDDDQYDRVNLELQKSYDESEECLGKYINGVRSALLELNASVETNDCLLEQICLYLPENLNSKLKVIFTHEFYPEVQDGDDISDYWDWVQKTVRPRPFKYVMIGLFALWRKENQKKFKQALSCYKVDFEKRSNESLVLFRDYRKTENGTFYEYVRDHFKNIRRQFPQLFNMFNPIDSPNVYNWVRIEREVFKNYLNHLETGLDSRMEFEKYNRELHPHFKDAMSLRKLAFAAEVSYFIKGTKQLECAPDRLEPSTLSHIFEYFGIAREKFDTATDFFMSRWSCDFSMSHAKELVDELCAECVSIGLSRPKQEELDKLNNFIERQ